MVGALGETSTKRGGVRPLHIGELTFQKSTAKQCIDLIVRICSHAYSILKATRRQSPFGLLSSSAGDAAGDGDGEWRSS